MNFLKIRIDLLRRSLLSRTGGLLALIVILGFALRFFHLGYKELWYDEVSSIAIARNANNIFSALSYKPLYFIFLKGWIGCFGASAFFVRFPSLLFGVASIVVLYLLGKALAGKSTGLIAAFLLAIACFHIYHSQQARQFTLMTLLVSLSFLFFIRALREKKAGANRLFNTGSNILLLFVHPYALLVVSIQALFVHVFLEWKIRRDWVIGHMITAGCVLVWFFLADKAEMVNNTSWIPKPGWSSVVEVFRTFVYGGERYGLDDYNVVFRSPWMIDILLLVYGVFLIKGILEGIKVHDPGKAFRLILLWCFLPMAGAWLVSVFWPVYLVKHLIFSLPAFYLIVASGVASLKSGLKVTVLLLSVFLVNLDPLMNLYDQDANIHWKEEVAFLKDNIKEGDAVIVSTAMDLLPFLYYFGDVPENVLYNYDKYRYCRQVEGGCSPFIYERSHIIVGLPLQRQGKWPEAVRYIAHKRLEALLSRKPKVIWLMVGRWSGAEGERSLVADVGKDYHLLRKEEGAGVNVYRFEKP